MITSYEQRGRDIGLQEGMQQGMQRMTLKILERRFGAPSSAIRARIEAISDPTELDRLFEHIEAAGSLDEVHKYLN